MSFAEVKPPTSGKIRHDAITTSASTEVAIPQEDVGYYTFISTVDVYILFGTAGLPAPDETETVDGELDIPYLLKADTEADWRIDNGSRHFRQKGTGTGVLRFYKSGN